MFESTGFFYRFFVMSDSVMPNVDDDSANVIPDASGDANLPRVAPRARLSRRGLSLSLAAAFSLGLLVYALFPENSGGPPLPVAVTVGKDLVPSAANGQPVLADVVAITNETEEPIRNLTLILNDHYLLMRASPLEAGQRVVLPQAIFTDKRSSQRFEPQKSWVFEVTVRGQLPNNQRGVSQFFFDEEGRERQ